MAVFSGHHRLSDAPSLTIADVVEETIGYNSLVPSEWMEPFWLGDLQSRQHARLVDIDARVYDDVLRHAGRMASALVVTTLDVPRLPSGTQAVRLADAPPVVFHVAVRRTDHRPEVRALLSLLLRKSLPEAIHVKEVATQL